MIEQVDVMAHGRPAMVALAGAVARAQRGRPLAPVTVVVPSNFAGLAARRLLASGRVGPAGVANVAFLTPFRLAELLAADLGTSRRPLTNPVLASAVRRALAADPGPYAEVAQHHATERAIAALYAELSHASEATLAALEEAGGSAAAAVGLHRRVAERLEGFAGEDELAAAAAERADLAAALAPFGHLVWYLPEPTTPALGRFLSAALAAAPATVVVGATGDAQADAPVRAAVARAGVAVIEGSPGVEVPVASSIVSVTDADDEVRAVVRRIAALAAEGVPLDRIGVFHPTPDPYVRTLRQQLAQAGIPANGPAQERLVDSVAGRTLLGALALPSQRWRRDRVLAVVSGAPVRHDGGLAHPTSWDAISRTAGVVHDLADWRRKLATHDERLAARASALDPEADAGRLGRLQRDRAEAAALGAFVEGLAVGVGTVERARSWADKAAAASALLRHLFGAGPQRQRWPAAEQEAADRVDEALARLAELDELEPDPSSPVFLRALTSELDVRRGRSGRYGEGVVYGPLSGSVGQDLDAVFVVGMAEGSCPAPRRDDAMLPDAARARAVDGELALRTEALHDQHRWFLAALAAAPPGRRWLLHPRGDLRGGRHRLPSRWLLDTASALAGQRVDSEDFEQLRGPGIEVVASFVDGLRTGPVPASAAERSLSLAAAHAEVGGDPADHPATAPVRRGVEAQRSRRSAQLTPWDGNLAGLPVPSPTRGQVLSATRLERWAGCGFRYLLADVLELGEREEPERVVELSAMERGSLVHGVLEQFLAEAIAAGPPDPDLHWSEAHRQRLHAIAAEQAAHYEAAGVTGRPVRWQLQREDLAGLLDDFLVADDAHRARTRSRPARVEVPFGLDDAPPVVVELADGRAVRFRGKADRVDVADDGRHLVSDYKTGKGRQYRHLDADAFRAGTTLQLGLYSEVAVQLLGAATASGHYWILNDESCEQRYGYDWTPDRRDRFVEVVTTIVDGIEAGAFPAVPGEWDNYHQTYDNCAYCPFDRVCPVDRGEHAAAKLAAPAVRRREPLTPPPEEVEP